MLLNYTCHTCCNDFAYDPNGSPLHMDFVKGKPQVYCCLACKVMTRPKHKYKAKRCESDLIKFSSKAERSYYHRLKALQQSGDVVFFLRQVPFDLPGNTKYFCDFQVFYSDGTVSFIDVKGVSTPLFVMKKKQVEDLYPILIEVVK